MRLYYHKTDGGAEYLADMTISPPRLNRAWREFPLIAHAGKGESMEYRITSQRQLRREFWQTFPTLPRKKITDYAGTGKMYRTDTRCAFVDWVDSLSKDGEISPELAQRATL